MASSVVAFAAQVGRPQTVVERPIDGRFYLRRLPLHVESVPRSMSATEPNIASGLAVPVPAMSGADPCTGSNRPGPGRRSRRSAASPASP